MERTNLRTMYHLEGDINDLRFNGEATKYGDGRISINGSFADQDANKSAYGSYSEDENGNASYNYSGNRDVVAKANIALPLLVEQEREYVTSLNV